MVKVKMFKKIMGSCLIALSISSAALAEETKLFRDYSYGMSKEAVQKLSEGKPCADKNLQGSICTPHFIKFSGMEWEQAFIIQNNILVSVILAKRTEPQDITKIASAVINNGFILFLITSHNNINRFDTIEYLNKHGEKNFDADVLKFESSANGNISYLLIDSKSANTAKGKTQINSVYDILQNSPEDTRGVEIKVNDGITSIQFIAPVKFFSDMGKTIQEAKDSF